jgi:hypothetical protein
MYSLEGLEVAYRLNVGIEYHIVSSLIKVLGRLKGDEPSEHC